MGKSCYIAIRSLAFSIVKQTNMMLLPLAPCPVSISKSFLTWDAKLQIDGTCGS